MVLVVDDGRGDRRTLFALSVLKNLEGSKGCATSDSLMTEAGFVLFEIVVVVDLVIGLLAVSPSERHLEGTSVK
jgi:hypothetical protein